MSNVSADLHVNVTHSADVMREALQLNACCNIHRAMVGFITAVSFVADIAGDDRTEMKRLVSRLTEQIFRDLESGQITFTRG